MGKLLIQYEPEVMIFDSMQINNMSETQTLVVKGYDVDDENCENDLLAWVFDTKTIPLLQVQKLKQGDLLFWINGELIPMPFPKDSRNISIFKRAKAS